MDFLFLSVEFFIFSLKISINLQLSTKQILNYQNFIYQTWLVLLYHQFITSTLLVLLATTTYVYARILLRTIPLVRLYLLYTSISMYLCTTYYVLLLLYFLYCYVLLLHQPPASTSSLL